MGIRLKQRRKLEETIVGQITNSMASLKVRNNMTLQMNKSTSYTAKIKNKSLSLYSARVDAGKFS